MGKTLIEKIIGKASGKEVNKGEIVFVSPYRTLSHDNSAAISKIFYSMEAKKVWDHGKIVIVLDHAVPPPDERKALNHKIIRKFVSEQGIKNFYDCGIGICHQVLPEYGHVLPGKLILGADSHTTTHGAFGAAGIAIGRTELASVWAIGETWLKVPETIKINLKGGLRKGVYAKDIILHIIGELSAGGANYLAVEFYDQLDKKLTVSERMTICNMSAEMGAKAAIFPADEMASKWLSGRASLKGLGLMRADADAGYKRVIDFDLTEIEPLVACPHKVDSVKPVRELGKTEIDVALLGTCINGRLDDLEVASKILAGKRVKARLLVYPASREVLLKATKLGYIEKLLESGAQVAVPSCGPCLGAYGGVLAPEEKCISTANRNFKGRMGCKEGTEIYLASPATVASSALAGQIKAEV
jgi:3-isopropylmalate dehydratase large subunit